VQSSYQNYDGHISDIAISDCKKPREKLEFLCSDNI